jgi:hypothetical protein
MHLHDQFSNGFHFKLDIRGIMAITAIRIHSKQKQVIVGQFYFIWKQAHNSLSLQQT